MNRHEEYPHRYEIAKSASLGCTYVCRCGVYNTSGGERGSGCSSAMVEEIAALRARVAELVIALRAWEHLAEQDTSTADYLTAHTILTDGLAPHHDAENLTDLARRALAERDAAKLEGATRWRA